MTYLGIIAEFAISVDFLTIQTLKFMKFVHKAGLPYNITHTSPLAIVVRGTFI